MYSFGGIQLEGTHLCLFVCLGVTRDEHAWLWQPDAGSVKRTNGTLPHEIPRGKKSFRNSCCKEASLRNYVCEKKRYRNIEGIFFNLWWCFSYCVPIIFCFMFTQITLGRATKDKPIDVDLALEGPAWKISRKQGEWMNTLWCKTMF